ncbi:hypothetical protein INP83_18365 [Mucilaginibacter sp. 21P]|uniref:hypothetical protein n=1 Tax=Mucilaginibacter sp. 21P TaxID=2778902 RepID=UPI001C580B94|nr:hypothetical protein [Mucilaginibacter sp. 21P]QXV65022.1 hypothetical protein INP83_18365 [Mucilaginibacter sp. 21P]
MRTSLNNTKLTDDYVNGMLPTGDALLMEARLILNPDLDEEVDLHKRTLNIVRQYGRESLRAQIEDIHQQLFTKPQHRSFKDLVFSFFER